MKNRHIIKILDRKGIDALSGDDPAFIKTHIQDCRECRQAFQSARISSVFLKNFASAASPEINPFFREKVLNAWREKQNPRKPERMFYRWWQASAALIFMMLLIIGGLATFTFLTADTDSPAINADNSEAADSDLYSADLIILNQKNFKNLTAEQVFEVIENSKNER